MAARSGKRKTARPGAKNRPSQSIRPPKPDAAPEPQPGGHLGRFEGVVLVSFAIAYLYVLLEWLFFLTKPSFLSAATLSSAIVALGLTPLGILVPAVLVASVCFAIAFVVHRGHSNPALLTAATRLSLFVPAVVGATLLLLLIDNFTYTIWQFGIVNAGGVFVWIYTFVFLPLVALTFRRLERVVEALSSMAASIRNRMLLGAGAGVLVSVLCVAFADHHTSGWSKYLSESGIDPATIERPNILIYSSDGVSATHLSAYGYKRETTPFIDEFVRDHPVLFFENAFSNAANTGGSLTSLLTGKYPFTLRLLQAPQILRGRDALEHLPGMLRNLGYRSTFYGMRYFADPFDFNMLDSFDTANNRAAPTSALHSLVASVAGQTTTFFGRTLYLRASERILHLLHIRPIEDVYATVTKGLPDAPRYSNLPERLIAFIDASDQPFFVFAHNMGTHGPEYFNFPPTRKFSAWNDRMIPYDLDYYDDGILGYDGDLREVIGHLERTGKLANTIVVIASDHGWRWNQLERVPLIMYFPDGRHAGRTRVNVQNLDIAPTLLDYLGLPKPSWMEGRSILEPDAIDEIPIIGTRVLEKYDFEAGEPYHRTAIDGRISPTYLFARFSGIYCDTALDFDMREDTIKRKSVQGHTPGCEHSNVPDDAAFRRLAKSQLQRAGFDVSFIDEPEAPVEIEPDRN